jgi:hypothetical protein
VRPGPAILVTLAPRYATGDPVGFYQMIAGVLFAFGVALLDGVSVPF